MASVTLSLDPFTIAMSILVVIVVPLLLYLLKKCFTKSSTTVQEEVAPNDRSTVTVCLGRSFKVGMLYNSSDDRLLTKKMLWNDHIVKKATTTASQEEEEDVDFEVISSDTLATKVYQLGIETDLSLSVVSESIEVSKSAEYLHDVKTSSRQARVVLKCQRFTKSDKLIMKKPAKFNVDPSILRDGTATHVVVGVKYGSEAFFVFDQEVPEDEDYDSVCREMESLVRKIPSIAKGQGYLSERESLLASKLQCRIHSDQPVLLSSSTFNDVISIYKRFLTDTRTEVPKVAWLYPLHLLDKEAPTVHSIEHQLTMKTFNVLDSFHILVTTANTLSKHKTFDSFPALRDQLAQFKTVVEQKQKTFKEELSPLLPEIRRGNSTENKLKNLIADSHDFITLHDNWLNGKNKEMNCLSQYLDKLDGFQIFATRQQFDLFVKRKGGANCIVSLEFQVGQEKEFVLNEKHWCNDTNLRGEINEKIKKFVSYAKSPVKKDIQMKCVVVLGVNKDSRSLYEGVIVYLYNPGHRKPQEFEFSDGDPSIDDDNEASISDASDDENNHDIHAKQKTKPLPIFQDITSQLCYEVKKDKTLCEEMPRDSDSSLSATYKLRTRLVLVDKEKNIAKCEFGEPNVLKPTKVIMVMGATGAGKSTLINGMVNYILGVKFDDDFRFKLICDETTKSQSHSQTNDITAYTLFWQEGFIVPYTLTIIDTPGFGDTRGLERDNLISKQVKELFTIQGDHGIDQIHAVGFVTPSALARLTPTQCYIFDSILSIFGKDIANNIFVMATFADSGKPAVLDALKEAKLPHANFFPFNNSALFISPQEGRFSKSFWEMGISSFQAFFANLHQLAAVSLSMTREVLQEREKLEAILNSVQPKMTEGLSKMETLRQEETMLRGKESQIMSNKDFTYEVNVTKQAKVELESGTYVTNCLICNFTCHKPCGIPNDGNKYNCAAMDTHNPNTAKCRVCPQKCGWREHRNNPYYFRLYTETETRTSKDLLSRYKLAASDKVDVEAIIRKLHEDLDDLSKTVITDVREARHCIERLGEIALKPNPMTEVEYIDLLIKSENEERKEGYQERVKSYENMKKKASLMTKMSDEQLQESLQEKGTEGKKKWWQFWRS